MYITDTTDNVRNLFEELEGIDDLNKLKFLIYIFGLLNNKQINNKNEANPNLIEDDELEIFTLDILGLTNNACAIFLQFLIMIYNGITNTKDAYEDNGNILGIKYDDLDNKIASQFEKLNYSEKLDIFKEIFIRYDNETYFYNKIPIIKMDSNLSGFDIAKIIDNFKNK